MTEEEILLEKLKKKKTKKKNTVSWSKKKQMESREAKTKPVVLNKLLSDKIFKL